MAYRSASIQARMVSKPPFTVETPGAQQVEGETLPRRNKFVKDNLQIFPTADTNIKTTWDLIQSSSRRFGNAKAIGSRKLINTHVETKKVKKVVDGVEQEVDKNWTYFELGDFEFMSFVEYETLCRQVGAGLRKLGLNKEDRVHIFAATSAHWFAMSHACASQSMPIVTAYDTLGEQGLRHSLVQTGAKAVFLDPHLLTALINPLKDAKEIKYVIWNSQNEVKDDHVEKLMKAHERLTILSFEDLRKLGEENPVDPVPATRDDLCCIMYTSGSTGTPKGVPLRHRNVIAAG